jgi:phage terminase large subunit GpA-like protein
MPQGATLQSNHSTYPAIYTQKPEPIPLSLTLINNARELLIKSREALMPPPDLKVSEWAEQTRFLPSTANIGGRWRNVTTPHLAFIMDAFTDTNVEEITLMGSAQIGKTSIFENFMGYVIDIMPSGMLYMAPTVDVAKVFSEEKFDPMIENTPALAAKVARRKSRDSKNTKLYKRFYGGFIKFVGANSPHGLRQLSVPYVFSDDIDSILVGKIREGDPVLRAEKRTQTFRNKVKKIRASTPTRKKFSRIELFFSQGSMHRYYVTCPDCKQEQILKFDNVVWNKDTDPAGKILREYPETARLQCEQCRRDIYERDRRMMLQNGYWKAEHPERKRHLSFHINELSSTLSTIEKVVQQRIASGSDPEKMEVFTNTVLGECWQPQEAFSLQTIDLISRAENYLSIDNPYLPDGVLLITCGVDVQQDRLEVQVVGWGAEEEAWVLYYSRLDGNTEKRDVWDQLDSFRKTEWTKQDGSKLKILRTFVDSGFQGKGKLVYEYARVRKNQSVYAVKGAGRYGRKLFSVYPAYNKTILF